MIAKWQMQIMVVIFSSYSKLGSRSTTIVINLNILSSRNKRGSILVNCMVGLSTGFGKMRIVMGVFSCNLGVWQYRLWGFHSMDTELEWFLNKNQHTQKKLLNFENWCIGEVSKSAKIWLSKSMSKIKKSLESFYFFSLKETNLGAHYYLLTFFITKIF